MAAQLAESPGKVHLLDGALGTELGRRGLPTRGSLFSAAALLDERGRAALREVHREYVDAGAGVITAATFRTNRRALAAAGLESRFPELARLAVREARDAAGTRARVAGSLAPLEDCYRPDLRPPAAQASREHLEHARALAGAGCDLLLVETVAASDEGLAAVAAAAATGLPVWVAAMATPGGTMLDGSDLAAFFRSAVAAGASAALINCTPPDGVDLALGAAASAGVPFGAYAHLGEVDPAVPWGSAPDLPPDEYARRALRWIERGASIVGGCCGTRPAHIRALAVALAAGAAQKVGAMDVQKLLAERAETLASFKDPHRSPYAAVDRRDFQGATPLVLGSGPDADLRLEETKPRHVSIAVEGGGFRVRAVDPEATVEVAGKPVREARVEAGATIGVGRYTVRLSHQNFPALVLLDPQSPRVRDGPPPRWFPPDEAFRVTARLDRDPWPRDEVVLSTRGNARRSRRLGTLTFDLGGRTHRLTALRLLEPGVGEAAISVFFRDATTGHETYAVGRYLEPEPVPGDDTRYVLDFNRAYNPTCAFSAHYNCPIPPRENVLQVPVRAGEMDPGGH